LGRIVEYEFATHTAWCYHISAKIHGDNLFDLRVSFSRTYANCDRFSANSDAADVCLKVHRSEDSARGCAHGASDRVPFWLAAKTNNLSGARHQYFLCFAE